MLLPTAIHYQFAHLPAARPKIDRIWDYELLLKARSTLRLHPNRKRRYSASAGRSQLSNDMLIAEFAWKCWPLALPTHFLAQTAWVYILHTLPCLRRQRCCLNGQYCQLKVKTKNTDRRSLLSSFSWYQTHEPPRDIEGTKLKLMLAKRHWTFEHATDNPTFSERSGQ
jgi:hypothetical protein